MKTIKLPIQNSINIKDLQRVYSSAVRFAYNRHIEAKSEKEAQELVDKACKELLHNPIMEHYEFRLSQI